MRRGIIGPMKYRKLRIAWSVGWGVVAVLLVVLWVRSYWHRDTLVGQSRTSGVTFFFSQNGEVQYLWEPNITPDSGWEFNTYTAQDFHGRLSEHLGYWYVLKGTLHSVVTSYWAILFFATATAAVPWLRWHFSLRTLLIATTLVAAGLGLIVCAMRK